MTAWFTRPRHCLVIPALLALATVAAVLLPAAPAQARSTTIWSATIWSATLTVDAIEANNNEYQGCDDNDADQDNCSTALSDNQFTYDGTTYRIKTFYIQSYTPSYALILKFDKAIPTKVRNALTLHVGSSQFALSSLLWGTGNKSATKLASGLGPWTDGQSVSLKLTAPTKPAKPTGLTATPGNGKVELAWADPSDSSITKYQYQQKEGTNAWIPWRNIPNSAPGGTNATSYTVTWLNNGNAYRFRIRAVNAAGHGPQSDIVATRLKSGPSIRGGSDTTGPSVSSIAVTSSPPTGQGGYYGYYKAGDVIAVTVTFDEAIVVSGTPALEITLGTAAKSATCARKAASGDDAKKLECTYTVATGDADADGVSVAANKLTLPSSATIKDVLDNDATRTYSELTAQSRHKVDSTDPGIAFPTAGPRLGSASVIKLTDANAKIKVYGAIEVPGTATDATGCDTESEVGSANLTTLATPNASVNFSYTPPSGSVGMQVCIYAEDVASNSRGALWTTAIAETATKPARPTGFTATAGNAQVALSWADPGNSSITKYQCRQREGSAAWGRWTDIPNSAPGGTNATSYTMASLMNGTAYRFRIRAVNAAGNGAQSDIAGPATPASRYSQAQGLTDDDDTFRPAKPAGVWAAASDGSLTLNWNDPSDATITRYQYQIKKARSSWHGWKAIPGSGAATTSHTIDNLTNGTAYTLRIRAFDGGGAGAASKYVRATPGAAASNDTFRPAKPEGVWATAGDGSLTLNWNDPSDATITRYQYQIKEARSAWHGWKDIPGSGAATTSHTVTGLDNATAYTLRIRAFDRGGAGAASKYVRATPGAAASSEALTARFAGPARHLGKWRFIVWIAFSEPVTIRAKEAAKSLQVTGGRVMYAKRAAGGAAWWEIRVKRDSQGPVTIRLPATSYCGASGAVCTADGRKLSSALSLTVPLVPALRVSNARAQEGTDATIDFRVTMDRAATGPVTVDYATEDGTATAGTDYTTTSGRLTFAVGETQKTVSVPVLDDATDEGKETFTLRLSNARGARLFDDEGRGIIKNADPMPAAWLARFGRTVGTHVTDAVGERLRGTGGQGSHVTIGGSRVPLGRAAEGEAGAASASGLLRGVAGILGLGPAQLGSAGGEPPGGNLSPLDPRLRQSQSLNLDLRQILLGSAFRLNLNAADAGAPIPRLTAWGRFAGTTFDGQDGKLSLDGDVFTGTVGVDGTWDRLLAGVAVAHSRGDGSFNMAGTEDPGQGDLEQTLTSIHPYLRYAVTDRLDVWGLVGYGWGELDVEKADGETLETDTTLLMGAFGGRGVLLAPAESEGFQLATRTDAMFTRTSSDAVAGMASSDGDAHRLRVILEGSRGFTWADGQSLTPTVELGLRHDWGDAETGFGLEVGGRVQYADPALGLTVEGAVRGLLAHEDADYEEWGAWGTVRVAPGADGQGLALTLAPAWGATASGVEGLWSRQTTAGLAPQGPRGPAAGRLTAEVGYGFAAFDAGLLTPYGGMTLAQGGTQQYRLGARLAIEDGLTLNLEGAHRQPGAPTPADTGLLLRLELPW